MTEQERTDELAYYGGGPTNEEFDWNTSSAQLSAAGPPPDVPMLMLISTIAQCDRPDDICGRTYAVNEAIMRDVAAEWPQGTFLQLEGEHELFLTPDAVMAIRSVINAARDPSTWATAFATPLAATPQS